MKLRFSNEAKNFNFRPKANAPQITSVQLENG